MATAVKKLSQKEKEWRAEDDARTLKYYEEVVADAERYEMAKKVLEREAKNIASALDGEKANGII